VPSLCTATCVYLLKGWDDTKKKKKSLSGLVTYLQVCLKHCITLSSSKVRQWPWQWDECWVDQAPERQKCWVSELNIVSVELQSSVATLARRWNTLENYLLFNCTPESFSFPTDSLFKLLGKLIWKERTCISCMFCLGWTKLFEDNWVQHEVLKLLLFHPNFFQYANLMDHRPKSIYQPLLYVTGRIRIMGRLWGHHCIVGIKTVISGCL
jgi:hypothetical protein